MHLESRQQNFYKRTFFFIEKVCLNFFKIGSLVFAFCFIAWNLLIFWISPINRVLNLPNIEKLKNYAPISSIEVYDYKDQLVSLIQSEEDRQVIALDQVSIYLKQSLIATEDRNFYSHSGIDIQGILRAIFVNVKSRELREGASTITQQLVKNIFFHPSEWRTIKRKLKEFLIALEIEKNYTKDEILEAYLNQVFWGNGAYGISRAAQKYFNKKASNLNLAESAYLVGLLTSPSSLHRNKAGKERQIQILSQMEKNKYITFEEKEKALKQELKFESAPGNLAKFPFYMSVVLKELKEHLDKSEIQRLGLKIYTSLDQDIQKKSKEILNKEIKEAPKGISQGALVLVDVPTNQFRAIVGGVGNFWEHQWNRATSPHTMGSVFKPFVYLTSFEKGLYTSESKVLDAPLFYVNPETKETWEPKNFDKKFRGKIKVKVALTYSRNIPAIRVAKHVKVKKVQEMSSRFGLKIEPFLSSALGSSAVSPFRLANAYTTLARRGVFAKPIVIRRIEDKDGNILFQAKPEFSRIVSQSIVDELVQILENVVERGTGRAAFIPNLSVAGKTGTSDNSKDVWFAGFTPHSTLVLWGGNDSNQEASHRATGGGCNGQNLEICNARIPQREPSKNSKISPFSS